MDVKARQNMGVGMVLQRGEPGEEFPLVVVVKENDYAYHFFPFLQSPSGQRLADQVPNGFRTVRVALLLDELVEGPKKLFFHGDPKTQDFSHTWNFSASRFSGKGKEPRLRSRLPLFAAFRPR
jgi:hypothetical protein